MKLNSLDKQFLGIIQTHQERNQDESLKWDSDTIIKFAQKLSPALMRKPLRNLRQSCLIAMEQLKQNEGSEEEVSPITEENNQMNDSLLSMYSKVTQQAQVQAAEQKEPVVKRRKTEKMVKEESKVQKPSAKLSDVGGMDEVIHELLELIGLPLTHPEIFTNLGIDPPRGVLLYGPPGTGKTMLANAIANEINVPFISIAAPVIVSGMSGESEKKLREVFQEAKQQAPCILFIDEIDAITPKRETAQREMERRIVAQFLTCMDGNLIFYDRYFNGKN